ncbi:MAG: hypothetical protein WBZ36_30170 [Candidatus Nitrosopolaris sp.]
MPRLPPRKICSRCGLLFVSAVITQADAFWDGWGGPSDWGGWNGGYPYVNCRIFILSTGPCL